MGGLECDPAQGAGPGATFAAIGILLYAPAAVRAFTIRTESARDATKEAPGMKANRMRTIALVAGVLAVAPGLVHSKGERQFQ